MNASLISIIIPVCNEEQNIVPLYTKLHDTLSKMGTAHEIIFIDDGSTDDTYRKIKEIDDKNIKLVRFQKTYGKTAALSCGFSKAVGDVVITMDGDLQDDPKEIPRFIEALGNYDVVSGWKFKRHDPLTKTIPSKAFNWLTKLLSGVNIHDFNSGYKAFKKNVVENIYLYGEMHRYIPVIASWKGYNVGEIKVDHHPRINGRSKYGAKRVVNGFFDLITILFLMSYKQRPMHLFGSMGFVSSGIGVLICAYLSYLWINGHKIGERPLLMLGVLLIIIGVQFVAMGLIGELIINNKHEKYWIIRDE